jgi:acetoacetyl-CoA reductase
MNRLVLITGGTRGIGKSIAIACSDAGYKVVVSHYGDDEAAQKFSDETKIPVYCWDVSKFDDCHKFVDEIEKKHGSIDILVNNAGIIKDGFMHKMSRTDWDTVINVNLSGCFNMCSALIGKMRERNYGRIVNIASINALSGQIGQVNYVASKAGIIGLTKSLALESAKKNITINAIAPGYVETDMTNQIAENIRVAIAKTVPVGRFGKPEEISRGVVFLIDENAGFITGETLSINGGGYLQ